MSEVIAKSLDLVNSGWVLIGSDGVFFFKLGVDKWLSIVIPNMHDLTTLSKLSYVGSKLGTTVVNKAYIGELSKEFNVSSIVVDDVVIIKYLTQQEIENDSGGKPPEGNYEVVGDSVVVNGKKYGIGSEVLYGGYRYLVKKGSDGAYLSHPTTGSIEDTPITEIKEAITKIDYTNTDTIISPIHGGVYVEFNNNGRSNDRDKLFVPSKSKLRRVLRATSSTSIRYYECFRFYSGATVDEKIETVVTGEWSGANKLSS